MQDLPDADAPLAPSLGFDLKAMRAHLDTLALDRAQFKRRAAEARAASQVAYEEGNRTRRAELQLEVNTYENGARLAKKLRTALLADIRRAEEQARADRDAPSRRAVRGSMRDSNGKSIEIEPHLGIKAAPAGQSILEEHRVAARQRAEEERQQ